MILPHYMLKRQQIRYLIIDALRDETTRRSADCEDIGLTLAEQHILDTHLDPLQLHCEGEDYQQNRYQLPAIAVYTEDEELNVSDPENGWHQLCFDRTQLTVVIELYVCEQNGYRLEAVLDEFEEQVRYKLLLNPELQKITRMRGWQSRPMRNNTGRRLGMRRLTLTLEYHDQIHQDCDQEPMKFLFDWNFHRRACDPESEPTEPPEITTEQGDPEPESCHEN